MAKPKTDKNKEASKAKKIKPELPGGFRDFGPAEAIIKQRLIERLRKTFEDFGFDPIETPAVERTEILTGGEKESQKIIFNVKGSKEKKSDMSLRFDLTVPLARFLAANPETPKPFRRYQIGRAWRGESPQAGRYREFTQADIDIVGSSSMEADSEITALVYQIFKNLGIKRFVIKINNRKILNGLPQLAGFPEKKLLETLRIIDKKDKIGEAAVKKELTKLLKKKAAEKVEEFIGLSGDTKNKLMRARELFRENKEAAEGVDELVEIARNLNASGVDPNNWKIDFSTVRGLDYYTGPVFETVLLATPEYGSVASGGRYDNLMIPFTGQKIPAVGISIGVDRFLAALDKLGLLKKRPTRVKILILNLGPEFRPEYFSFAKNLRGANLNTELYVGDDRSFQAQLAYAVKKEIPYVLIYGDQDRKKGVVTIRNLVTREQKEIPKGNILLYFKK
ncbi:MAG: histidine--tRNA ligase [Candidatus Sungiibacteriota bacterium]|uniref:Histidine--tRNA ligase n=1 Tax=Candidatus Sungiibacteriota bacterium TaxID=2750080 RepID=A0A7T5RK39_9BACT|nr:MAG: histidine--tRNA ligase [Candidatus Sungbacteria bacterium]